LLATTPGAEAAEGPEAALTELEVATTRTTTTTPFPAFLDQKRVLSYPFDQVWPSAVRYLRIDRGYKITERDSDAGFILFSFPVGAETPGSGSVEMLKTLDAAGRPSVEMRISTQAGPSHLPHTLLEGIAAKVRAERGQPPPPPPPEAPKDPPPKDSPDGGGPPLLPPATEPGQPPA
jgi:hypothetical protein